MAWVEVTPTVRTKFDGKVTFGIRGVYDQALLGLPGSVVASLGWKAGDRLALELGGGKDGAGKIRLRKVDEGVLQLQISGKGKRINLGRFRGLSEGNLEKAVCQHAIEAGALIVTLPAGALQSETVKSA